MAELALKDIHKGFGNHAVLKGVSLDVQDGEFLTIVGPSGCGKSTLLRIVAGLESHNSGQVLIGGAAVNDRLPGERDIAMVFQSYALYPHLSVFDNIAVPLRYRRLSPAQRVPLVGSWLPSARRLERDIEREVQAVASLLDIGHLLPRRPSQLSGGQRQRVALGRAIVRQPSLFLMDEPLSNLDAKLRTTMRAELTQLHQRIGTTFLYVTHDQVEAMTMSDRVAIMFEGRFEQIDTPQRLYAEPATLSVAEFIGTPRINRMQARSDGRSIDLGNGMPTLPVAASGSGICHVCFRPESAGFGRHELTWPGKITFIEDMGPEIFVHLAAQGFDERVIVRATRQAAAQLRMGQETPFGVAVSDVLVFGPDGRRIALHRTGVAP